MGIALLQSRGRVLHHLVMVRVGNKKLKTQPAHHAAALHEHCAMTPCLEEPQLLLVNCHFKGE